MPRHIRSQQFRLAVSQNQRAILADAHRAAGETLYQHMQGAYLTTANVGYAWVELDPSPFTRWCKNHTPVHAEVPVAIHAFFGEAMPKSFLWRFMNPGAPANEPLLMTAAQAAATSFAMQIKHALPNLSPRVVSAWGNKE